MWQESRRLLYAAAHEATPYKETRDGARKKAGSHAHDRCTRQEGPTIWRVPIRLAIIDGYYLLTVLPLPGIEDGEATDKCERTNADFRPPRNPRRWPHGTSDRARHETRRRCRQRNTPTAEVVRLPPCGNPFGIVAGLPSLEQEYAPTTGREASAVTPKPMPRPRRARDSRSRVSFIESSTGRSVTLTARSVGS